MGYARFCLWDADVDRAHIIQTIMNERRVYIFLRIYQKIIYNIIENLFLNIILTSSLAVSFYLFTKEISLNIYLFISSSWLVCLCLCGVCEGIVGEITRNFINCYFSFFKKTALVFMSNQHMQEGLQTRDLTRVFRRAVYSSGLYSGSGCMYNNNERVCVAAEVAEHIQTVQCVCIFIKYNIPH